MAASAFYIPVPLILAALALDALAGDPAWLPHPVRSIGGAISWGERRLRSGDARKDLFNGSILSLSIIALAAGATWVVIELGGLVGTWLASSIAIVVAWTTLAIRGLDDAAKAVETSLRSGDERGARDTMPALVGRDPAALDRNGMIRATVESIAENLSDGVVAPLLFLFVGGPIAAMAYKAVNTLDSMIGYRNEKYLHFGRAAARIDDVVNFVPARLSALCIAVAAAPLAGRTGPSFNACLADAGKHASPNAGFPESAMAGALGIQLGGDAIYDGEIEHRAPLGSAERAVTIEDIALARAIMWTAAAIAFGAPAAVRYGVAGA